jgi:hypothetical protein
MAMTGAARREEEPLTIELYGEARNTAEWLARQWGATPADVVARALGVLWFLVQEEQAQRRVVTETLSGGDRRQIDIKARAGDAGTNVRGG